MPARRELGTLVPDAVRVVRVQESGDWVRLAYEVEFEGEPADMFVLISPEDYMGQLVAALKALDFPQEDLDYIADRFLRSFS